MKNTKVTVITINYNNIIGIEKTILSVINQSYPSVEFVVIDGASNDGSLEIIEKYKDKIDYWVSEKDSGIYNAMNKGIHKATSDYLFFLNSGDEFYDNYVLEKMVPHLNGADVVYGDVIGMKKNSAVLYNYNSKLTFKFWVKGTICHQGAFINKRCFDVLGDYDEKLKISADWKFFILGFGRHNFSFVYNPITISKFYEDGISSDVRSMNTIARERKEVLEEYFPLFIDDYEHYLSIERKSKLLNPENWIKIPGVFIKYLRMYFIKQRG